MPLFILHLNRAVCCSKVLCHRSHLNCSKSVLVCLRWTGRLFHSLGLSGCLCLKFLSCLCALKLSVPLSVYCCRSYFRMCRWCSSRCYHHSRQRSLAHSLCISALPSHLSNSRHLRSPSPTCRLLLLSEVSFFYRYHWCQFRWQLLTIIGPFCCL